MSEHDHRLLDLLAARATEGLTGQDAAMLDRLLKEQDVLALDDLDLAAASADLAFQVSERGLEPMPASVKQRVLANAEAAVFPAVRETPSAGTPDVLPFRKSGPFSGAALGWYAAAAMLVLALWSPWRPRETPAPVTLSAEQQRAQLIESATDLIQVRWAPSEFTDYAQVRGDVIWSNEQQTGFMRFSGLPANRSSEAQYQLWIVDPTRDERPIDGGVFDVAAGATEIVVPIDSKLRVDRPAAFAVTLEQPGGVVVSDGPLLIVAPVDA